MRNRRLVLLVAREETGRYFRGFNRRVLGFIVVAAAIGAVLFPPIMERGVVPDEGLYRAEVTPQSPLLGPLRADRRVEVTVGVGAEYLECTTYALSECDIDLFVEGTTVRYVDTERGQAAVHDFSEFTERYYDEQLAFEQNQSAAFPVRVNVVYQARALSGVQGLPDENQGGGPSRPTGSGATYTTLNSSLVLNQTGESQLDLTPGKVEPPFPMRSLLLTFLYLVPMNFISQYYASSLLAERTRNRGLLLLSAPLTGPEILLGKSLPYIVITLILAVAITLYLGAGIISFIAILPVLGFFLASTSFAALIARSYRELTFLITTMSVGLSTFLFLPAIFTQVHPIAFISPISVVAAQLRNESVPFASLLYSITPITFAALVLGIMATTMYREEMLFAPKKIVAKVLDSINLLVHGPKGFLVAGIVALPFVFGVELFLLAFCVTLPIRLAILVFLIGVATIEEIAKALPSLAHYRGGQATRRPWIVGLTIGIGFFLGEKVGLFLSVIGLQLIPLGETLLTNYGVAASLFLVLAPLALHIATATISAYSARAGRWTVLVGIPVAIAVHVIYNLQVIRLAS
jgi:ABC-type Na+ efflux pump permease subunit